MKTILLTIVFLTLIYSAQAQQYFSFGASFSNSRSEWYFQASPTTVDGNRIPVGWIKGQQSSPGVALWSTFAMDTDTIRFPKLNGSGVAVVGLNANGSLYRLNKFTLIDSTFFATRSWVSSMIPSVSGKLNTSDTSSMLLPYAQLSELTWTNISGKPGTFMPTAHMHGISEVLSLQDSLDAKYPRFSNPSGYLTSVPAQSFASLTGKPTTLAGYGITDAYPLTGNPSGFITSAAITGKLNVSDTASMLNTYLKKSTAATLYYPLASNPAGYITQTYNPTAGNGIRITGSYPSQTIAVDTSVASAGNNAVMYVGKANASITALQNGINSKEPIIAPGTTLQYWRGDKTWQTLNTTAVPEGSNLYWTAARFNTAFSAKTTTDLLEGTNQYYTDSRARSSISVTTTGSGSATYNSSTGVLNIPVPSTTAPGTNSTSAYGSGTAYTTTTTSAKVTFGTTSPSITLPSAGTYLIIPNVTIEYGGLTTVALSQCNFKVRRTNNTAADIPNAFSNFTVPIVTLVSQTAGDVDLQPVIYTTTNSNDVLEIWGNRGTSVSVGSIQVSQASIVAIRLY